MEQIKTTQKWARLQECEKSAVPSDSFVDGLDWWDVDELSGVYGVNLKQQFRLN